MHHPGTDKPPTFEIRANIDHLALEIESLVSPQKNEALHTLEKSIATLKTASRCEGVVIMGLRFRLLFRSSAIPVVTHITTTPLPNGGTGSQNRCYKCNKIFKNRDCFNRHMIIHQEKYKCVTCNKSFHSNSKLRRHQKTGQGCEMIMRHEACTVQCPMCDFRTTSKNNLQEHLVKHSGRFQCNICNHQFARKRQLQRHIKNPDNCMKYMA